MLTHKRFSKVVPLRNSSGNYLGFDITYGKNYTGSLGKLMSLIKGGPVGATN